MLHYYSHPEDRKITKQKLNQLGCSYLAFGVFDIDSICIEIQRPGGALVNPPILSNDKKLEVAYCNDNEGNFLEIVEVL